MSTATPMLHCMERDTHVLWECEAKFPLLLVCDHASNRIPPALNQLGMSEDLLATHIGWDIGAAQVSKSLGEALQVPVIHASNSRLVVDCNRSLDDLSAFPEVSDGVRVPGNQALPDEQRSQRAENFYWPYHHAIRDQLRKLEGLAAAPALIAIHSFTPEMDGQARPWHLGALWDKDSRIAKPFMDNLRSGNEVVVGDNEPYSGRHPADFTLDHHAEAEGLPHLGVELRQELISSPEGVSCWTEVLLAALIPILEDDGLYTHRAGMI